MKADGARLRTILLWAVAAAILAWSAWGVFRDVGRLGAVATGMRLFLNDYWPPDFDVLLEARTWTHLLQTLQIAVLATLLGLILSLPLALLCARIVSPAWVAVPARFVATALRVPPSILWAFLMVMVVGMNALAGALAMTLYTVGFLTKLQYEAFEGQAREALEAVRAMGANRFQAAWHVVVPEAQNALRSQLLFMFEYNVRASTVIGIVGAGGIGFLLHLYMGAWEHGKVTAILILIFATVLVLEGLSILVRRRFVELSDTPRPRWRDIFLPWAGRR